MVREHDRATVRELSHFIGGKHIPGTSGSYGDVHDPNTGEVQARVPLADRVETEAAITDAAAAQREWGEWNPQRRARVLLRLLQLVEGGGGGGPPPGPPPHPHTIPPAPPAHPRPPAR
ncbi:aldehyde dehydrogenase family protein, partial [Streptomyces mirabilis]|uniref:aldehyde dehydrogenase family protein n=1 Tax=Streptomyces mirabilis TaxID=68239 RepID=UPI0036B227A1